MYLMYDTVSLFSLLSTCNLCFENVIVDILLLYSRSSTVRKHKSKSATSSEIFTVYHYILPFNLDIFHEGQLTIYVLSLIFG